MNDAELMLSKLPADGSPGGNVSLREMLGWEALRYETAKEALLAGGRIAKGRGRGGSLMRADKGGEKAKVEASDADIEPRNPKKPKAAKASGNGTDLGFEATLWQAADKLRNNLDAAEYKHVVLGLIFLKYISDKFEAHRQKLIEGEGEYAGADPEAKDEYMAENVFWVPREARWAYLQSQAPQPTIGKTVDEAMQAIERENPRLKGILPKDYSRPAPDKHRLGELVNLISSIGLGDPENRSKDILGRVYEYFLSQFASAEGKKGGQFYTPGCVVALLVEMLAPAPNSRIYDPCCGSGGMFVQSEKFVEAHGGRIGYIAVYGQESNPTTRRLAAMNLAIRGIEADLGPEHADTFRRDLHPDLKADGVIANPPFNDSDWHRKDDDVRWQYGVPPAGNANYAWVQHFLHHLAPGGTAGFVLANGSMSSNQSGEGEIRKALIEAGLVDCMVALPGQLFYSTQIPVCLWFISRKKSGKPSPGLRPPSPSGRGSEARSPLRPSPPGRGVGGEGIAEYRDIPGFCKSAYIDEIREHGHVLTPGRYVGAEAQEEDGELFEEKMARLTKELSGQFAESARLESAIKTNLERLGFPI